MKTKIILIAIIFLSLAVITNAQPLPPTTPGGNPVPIGTIIPLLVAFIGFGVYKLKNRKK